MQIVPAELGHGAADLRRGGDAVANGQGTMALGSTVMAGTARSISQAAGSSNLDVLYAGTRPFKRRGSKAQPTVGRMSARGEVVRGEGHHEDWLVDARMSVLRFPETHDDVAR